MIRKKSFEDREVENRRDPPSLKLWRGEGGENGREKLEWSTDVNNISYSPIVKICNAYVRREVCGNYTL